MNVATRSTSSPTQHNRECRRPLGACCLSKADSELSIDLTPGRSRPNAPRLHAARRNRRGAIKEAALICRLTSFGLPRRGRPVEAKGNPVPRIARHPPATGSSPGVQPRGCRGPDDSGQALQAQGAGTIPANRGVVHRCPQAPQRRRSPTSATPPMSRWRRPGSATSRSRRPRSPGSRAHGWTASSATPAGPGPSGSTSSAATTVTSSWAAAPRCPTKTTRCSPR
jgi:hypothetical protein